MCSSDLEWAEMELRHQNFKGALELMRRATAEPSVEVKRRGDSNPYSFNVSFLFVTVYFTFCGYLIEHAIVFGLIYYCFGSI